MTYFTLAMLMILASVFSIGCFAVWFDRHQR